MLSKIKSQIAVGLTKNDIKRVLWTALITFLSTFLPLATGLASFHNYGEIRAAALALIPAALGAAFSALKNGLLSDTSALKG